MLQTEAATHICRTSIVSASPTPAVFDEKKMGKALASMHRIYTSSELTFIGYIGRP